MADDILAPLNLDDFETRAATVLPPLVSDYFASGADDQLTRAANRAGFAELALHYRVLAGIGVRDLSATVLGQRLAFPVTIAPMGFQRLAHPDGELASVRAAGAVGVPFVASTMANTAIEEIVAAATGPVWFQLYVFKDRGLTQELVQRAETTGCTMLQLTVDLPVLGRREADERNGFRLPNELTLGNFLRHGPSAVDSTGTSFATAYTREMFDGNLTWADVDWLSGLTRLPLLLKGIVRADDAVRALDHGAAGVVVSNHGGRQLDTAPATIRVLPEIAEAMAGRGTILLDGGVRRGTDIVKAIALGAHAVQVGRPVLWGLALGGEVGATRVLTLLRDEYDRALALCGCAATTAIPRDLVRRI